MHALLDTNVLVHAVYKSSPLHDAAAELVDRGLRRRGIYCIAPQNLIEFAAVVTRPRFVSPPLPANEVARITDLLYRSRRLNKIYPSRGTVLRAIRHGTSIGASGPRWYDVFLAMTMADAGVNTVITENIQDFRDMPFLSARSIQAEL